MALGSCMLAFRFEGAADERGDSALDDTPKKSSDSILDEKYMTSLILVCGRPGGTDAQRMRRSLAHEMFCGSLTYSLTRASGALGLKLERELVSCARCRLGGALLPAGW